MIYQLLLILFSFICIAGANPLDPSTDEVWHHLENISKKGYEWLYFDLHNKTGEQMSVSFLGPNPFDPRLVRHLNLDPAKHVGVMIQLGLPDGTLADVRQNYHGKNFLKFTDEPYQLQIGSSHVKRTFGPNGLHQYEIVIDIYDTRNGERVYGKLIYQSLLPGWKLRDGKLGNFGTDYSSWVVSAPKATVVGELIYSKPDGTIREFAIDGHGYHDHNWGTFAMPDSTDGWYWGRGAIGEYTVIFSDIWAKNSGPKANPGLNLLYVASESGGILTDGEENLFLYPSHDDWISGPNGIKYQPNFSITSKGSRLGCDIRIEGAFDRITHQDLPFYLREADKAKIYCGDKLLADNGDIIKETMDLTKLKGWFLKQVLKFWQ